MLSPPTILLRFITYAVIKKSLPSLNQLEIKNMYTSLEKTIILKGITLFSNLKGEDIFKISQIILKISQVIWVPVYGNIMYLKSNFLIFA